MEKEINAATLHAWIQSGKAVSILDIRPVAGRLASSIPGSIHVNVYEKLKQEDPAAFAGLHLDKSVPVVTVCGGGKTSLLAAGMLRHRGYEAWSLEGGMSAWDGHASSH